ncbi:STAS domain-containing protein [Nonomuraea aurantiaca]|uniref:STAS domain-containing protein n=1 Tax=Nonomuraea aurantiaca TaxID=2878562 RepID=UPI001CD9F48B|nr:STAS domain-containing protein [Nonomuraea aurantiaca]MCA2224102.1 STAS domain-containing protein [Nonomuraea aurantiaca]
MSWLTYACQHLPGATVIAVGGELDATNESRLDAFIRECRQRPGDHLVFDLAEVHFMDSAGLRLLLSTYTFSRQHGGSVRLAALQPMPARLVEVTRIGEHLPVHATLQDALTAALSPPEPPHRRPLTGNGGSGAA